jgi:hypothetical protein
MASNEVTHGTLTPLQQKLNNSKNLVDRLTGFSNNAKVWGAWIELWKESSLSTKPN